MRGSPDEVDVIDCPWHCAEATDNEAVALGGIADVTVLVDSWEARLTHRHGTQLTDLLRHGEVEGGEGGEGGEKQGEVVAHPVHDTQCKQQLDLRG